MLSGLSPDRVAESVQAEVVPRVVVAIMTAQYRKASSLK
jgi:hypothetical protein